MKALLIMMMLNVSLAVYGQNSLTITASPDGDGFATDTKTVTAAASKIKLNAGAVLKSFKLQCSNLAAGHQLVISVDGVSMAAGTPNSINDHNIHTFTFAQDIAERQITTTDVASAGTNSNYLNFLFTKGGAAPAPAGPAPAPAGPAPALAPAIVIATTFTIKYLDDAGQPSPPSTFANDQQPNKINIPDNVKALKSFIFSSGNVVAGHELQITIPGTALSETYKPGDGDKTITFAGLANKSIIVKDDKKDGSPLTKIATVLFDQPANTTGTNPNQSVLVSPQSAINIKKFTYTNYGYVSPDDPNTVHLFFDMFGNNLFGIVPTGIPNIHYVADIVYPAYTFQSDDVTYAIKSPGGIPDSGTPIFKNAGLLTTLASTFQSKTIAQNSSTKQYDVWKVKELELGSSSGDFPFTITTSVVGDDYKMTTGDLATYTIKMSTLYHGSFDVGLLNSHLSNPTFTLTDAPDGSGNKVIKTTDNNGRAMVSVMATFYMSPIVLIRSLIKKDVPKFKLTGRDFVDDHGLLERIYPTIGVGVNDKAVNNLLYGFNWEIARGLSFFIGRHWGKINTFDMPGYKQGDSVTQAQFDYYTNTKWATKWAYGVKVDIIVISNLFGAGTKAN